MNRRALLSVCLLSCLAPGAAAADSLQVVAKTPSGTTQSRRASEAVTATFNRPMTALDAPEQAGKFCPIQIAPAVEGRCRWQGIQVLSFEPEAPLPPATEFRAAIPAGTRPQAGGPALDAEVSWTFETVRPALVDSRPRHEEKWIDPKAEVFLHFNMEMDPRRARDFLTLEERDLGGVVLGEVSAGVRRARPEELKEVMPGDEYGTRASTANVLAVKPARLRPDRSYRLRLRAGLLAAQGRLGLAAERDIVFETWYSFRAGEFPAQECLPAGFRMAFSNPVRAKDLLAHMSVEPSTAMPELSEAQGEETGARHDEKRLVYHYLPDLDYRPDTLYAFRIDGRLKDVFGNELGADVRFTLETGGYCPKLRMPSGFGILESYLPPRHPVDAVNVQQEPLEKAYIPEAEFVPFYRGEKWNCEKSPSPKGAQAKLWDLTLRRNARLRTFIDLAGAFPPGARGGLVFSQVQEPGGCWLKAVDDVTRVGLTVKDSPDSVLVWTTFLRTGAPYGRVPVEIRGDDNRVLWQGATDAQGFARAPGWRRLGIKDWKRWQRPRLWVFARDSAGPAVMATDWRGGVSPWRFDIPTDADPRPKRFSGSLFTERGVYRPGETVRFKGILRRLEGGDWVPLGARADDPRVLMLTVTDSRDAVVAKATVAVSGYSAFDWSLALPEGAATGYWSVNASEPAGADSALVRPAETDEEGGGPRHPEKFIQLAQGFRVEAFKPATFEVKVAPGLSSYLVRDTYTAVLDGWYLFGAPMPEAPADWSLRLEPSGYEPPGYAGYDFSPGWWRQEARAGRVAGSGAGRLDGQGKLQVRAFLDPAGSNGPLAAVLEAGVTSPERQRLFGRATAVVHPAELYFGIKPGSYFAEQGKDWSAQIVAVRPDGTPARGLAAQYQLVRRDWLSAQRAGVGGRLEWVTEQRDTTVATGTWTTDGSTSAWTHAVAQPGEYFLTVSGRDEQGRAAEAAVCFYATGAGQAWWSRSDNDIIELVADKKLYRPGDTARILVKSPYPHSRALVTLEREGVMAHWLTQLDGGAGFVEVPLSDRHVPNVFVGVMLVQGRSGQARYEEDGSDLAKPQVKFGYVDLSVDPGGRRLKVRASSDREEYRPRGLVNVSLQALDEANHPAAGAELTVFAVDEGVLALTGYQTPDVFSDFYGSRPLLVGTADSRLYVIGQRSFGEKGESRGGGGGKGAGLEGIDLRSRFVPTAYWNPSVVAGPDGRAQVSFRLPDNLSRFRVMAVAQAGKRFGSGDSRFTVKKPLLLRPSLPRLGRAGDVFEAGAVVHNYTNAAATVTLEMTLAGESVAAEGAPRRELVVAAGAAVEALWTCRAVKPGSAKFAFRAAAGAETDGLEWTIPVRAPERLETVATTGVVEEGALVEELARPKDSQPGVGAVKAALSPTALAGLGEGARFLLEYPYGCLEQRLSRMLPVIAGAELTSAFGLGTVGSLKAKVQSELDRLSDFQAPSGGFAYWPSPSRADPYVTAYALEVAALAGKEGFRLPAAVLAKAVAWLKTTLTGKGDWAYPYNESEEYASRAYGVYALALHHEPMPGYFQQLFQRRDQLPFLAKAYLIKAAALVSKDQAARQILAADLLNQARLAPRSLHFEEPEETRMPWVHGSTVKATAVSLQALLEAQGGFAGDEKAVYWLVGERKARGRWRNTQENAASLRALQDFYRRYEKEAPAFTAELSLEGGATSGSESSRQASGSALPVGASLWSEKFLGRSLLARGKDFKPEAVFGAGDKARLRFSKTGTGRLYYTLSETYAPAGFDQAASEGFEIEKSVTPLYGKTLKAGGRAVVTITVRTRQDRTFVAVEDPLPAGFEIVDPSFGVESREDARALAEQGARGEYWGGFERAENYDDRIQIFADFLTAGQHRYSYLVQATTPGLFHWPAARVEQMYEPEVFGRTASRPVSIER
ncbi:MAG: MG2 domain-containing protein [Elusimicrobia bacterium]|nr:MG2 domain-containing protein [Elusimicrobiota bacterium]